VTPAPAATPVAPHVLPSPKPIGRLHGSPILHRPTGPAPAPGVTPPPNGLPSDIPASMVVTGPSIFGNNAFDPAAWKGTLYEIPTGAQKLPALATIAPKGYLFDSKLDIASQAMTGGFPGIDPARNTDFAIRFEAPLVVGTEADYTFGILSDDGSQVFIDDTLIVDDDGSHGATLKTGPVHLVVGTHALRVDYFQGTGQVALRLLCDKGATATDVCPTKLP
jgi:hypothetical protein